MGLCENVYRRGGVYWWRRRLRCGETASSYIRLSLKVPDPRAARRLASRVAVEADRVECVPMLSVEQQKDLLKIFVAAQTAQLERFARLSAHNDVDRRENAEPLEQQLQRKKRMATVCHLLAARGRSAQLMPDDAARLHGAGFTLAEIDDIRGQVFGTMPPSKLSFSRTPPRSVRSRAILSARRPRSRGKHDVTPPRAAAISVICPAAMPTEPPATTTRQIRQRDFDRDPDVASDA